MIVKWDRLALLITFVVAQSALSPEAATPTRALISELVHSTETLVATQMLPSLSDAEPILQASTEELEQQYTLENDNLIESTKIISPEPPLPSELSSDISPEPDTLFSPSPTGTAVESVPSAISLEEIESPQLDGEPVPQPPATEFLSFSEWRDKYTALPDTRKGKRGPPRPRTEGTTIDGGDGTELGSLFLHDVEMYEPMAERASVEGVGAELAQVAPVEPASQDRPKELINTERYPLQPLSNVGVGDATDPLLSLKDRSNYALFDCAAKVHRSSPQTKGASSILVEKKDRYMLTPCTAKIKIVELELCEEIRIDTIVLANFEFFSSMFKHFSIKVSMHYPGRLDEWHDLGTFRARNSRGVQVFHTNKLNGWYRYMRIDFVSHYGSEYYCPVSLLRVYGITQMDKFRQEQEEDAASLEAAREKALLIEDEEDSEVQTFESFETATDTLHVDHHSHEAAPHVADSSSIETIQKPAGQRAPIVDANGDAENDAADTSSLGTAIPKTVEAIITEILTATTISDSLTDAATPTTTTSTLTESTAGTLDTVGTGVIVEEEPNFVADAEESERANATDERMLVTSALQHNPIPTDIPAIVVPTTSIPSVTRSQELPVSPLPLRVNARNDTRVGTPPVATISPHSSDSIYGAITKRLAGLEHNHTLALNYIEAQSSMIRTAFLNVEQKLIDFAVSAKAQDVDFALALRNLEIDKLALDRDRLDLATKLHALAQEVQLERRLGVAQLLGLLALFVAVGVTRGSRPVVARSSSATKDERHRLTQVTLDASRLEEERAERNAEAFRKSFAATARATPSHKVQRQFSIPRRQGQMRPRPWTPPAQRHLVLPTAPHVFGSDESGTGSREDAKKSRPRTPSEYRSGSNLRGDSSPGSRSLSLVSSDASQSGNSARQTTFDAQEIRSRWIDPNGDATVYLSASEVDTCASAHKIRASQASTIAQKPPPPPRSRATEEISLSAATSLVPIKLQRPPPEPILLRVAALHQKS